LHCNIKKIKEKIVMMEEWNNGSKDAMLASPIEEWNDGRMEVKT